MHAAPGIGLAAPQVDVPLRLFVVDLSVGRTASDLQVFINPEIVERDGMQLEEEGCLSVPGFTATVLRPARVVVRAAGPRWQPQDGRGHGAAGPRAPARDGSPRRPALRAAPARPAARGHRAACPQARAPRPMVTHAPLRVVFFGTPEFAVPTLAGLLASRHRVVGVVDPARSAARPGAAGDGQPGQVPGARARRAGAAAREDARRGVSRRVARARRRPRRRRGLRAHPHRRDSRASPGWAW